MSRRGYFGIGIENNKFPKNTGTLWRTAMNFDADFIFTIGDRYNHQCTDTPKVPQHKPLLHWETAEQFKANVPVEAKIIGIEIIGCATDIVEFEHPERAIYVLGSEAGGMTEEMLVLCDEVVIIPMTRCANVAIAGAIVMYDRYFKEVEKYREG